MKESIRIGIAHRHRMFIECLAQALAAEPDLEVIGTATSGHKILVLARQDIFDVLVLDPFLENKDGLDVTKEITSLKTSAKILIYLEKDNCNMAYRFLKAGASGCATASTGIADLVVGMRAIGGGAVYLPPLIQQEILEHCVHPNAKQNEDQLTDREFQVMRLIAEGNANGEISNKLFISIKTVDTHRSNLLRKLQLRNNADLARFAIGRGFVSV